MDLPDSDDPHLLHPNRPSHCAKQLGLQRHARSQTKYSGKRKTGNYTKLIYLVKKIQANFFVTKRVAE
jgi:hypothetical protein